VREREREREEEEERRKGSWRIPHTVNGALEAGDGAGDKGRLTGRRAGRRAGRQAERKILASGNHSGAMSLNAGIHSCISFPFPFSEPHSHIRESASRAISH